jgi:hypothetical protein
MINPQELRIGNIIRFNEKFPEDPELELDNEGPMSEDDFNHMLIDEKFRVNAEYVPLTEDWLRRFGFKQYVHDSELQGKIVEYIYVDNLLTIVDWSAEGKKFTLSNSFSFRLRVDVNSVHQLQNLIFALTGKELTLTPLKDDDVPSN